MRFYLLLIMTLCVALSGCGQMQRPNLTRLYHVQPDEEHQQPPLILIHGLMGSKLFNTATQQEDWPGNVSKILFSNYRDVALPIDPKTLQPLDDGRISKGITDRAIGNDYYGTLIDTLTNAGGYQLTQPGTEIHDSHQRRLYIFSYDWRQDNVVSARKLSRLIEQIRKDYKNPHLKVDIVAHSMGGLIVRYYLRYGEQDVLNSNNFPVNMYGESRVRRVVLLGTPNLGSVRIVQAFIEGRKIGFNTIPPEVLLTMPSLYELFPHALHDWLMTDSLDTLDRDLFDVDMWRRFQWSIFDPNVRARIHKQFKDPQAAEQHIALLEKYFAKNLERARRFVWSLTVKEKTPPWQLTIFGGDCELTPTRLLVEEIKGDSVVRLWPDQVKHMKNKNAYVQRMLEPGDGEVTKASLLARNMIDPSTARHQYISFPINHAFFLCEHHDKLTSNINFQDNLLHTLLSLDQ